MAATSVVNCSLQMISKLRVQRLENHKKLLENVNSGFSDLTQRLCGFEVMTLVVRNNRNHDVHF